MIRHDVQNDVIEAHTALRIAMQISTQPGVLGKIAEAHDRVHSLADKFGIDITKYEGD